MEVGYVHFSNMVDNLGHTNDLGISGLAVYPSIQVSLATYILVWKKECTCPLLLFRCGRSPPADGEALPIIAPPEVLLNAHMAAAQGGLSGNVLFQYKNHSATKVELLADFNQWKPSRCIWIARTSGSRLKT